MADDSNDVEITQPTRDAVEELVEKWVALASDQRQYGSHLLPAANRSSIHEMLMRHLVTARLLVARLDGSIVGFVTFEIETGYYIQDVKRGVVEHLYVDPQYRSAGIGSQLLEAAQEKLRDRDVDAVMLNVLADNEDARRFYRQHGFSPHRIEMEKPLDDETVRSAERTEIGTQKTSADQTAHQAETDTHSKETH